MPSSLDHARWLADRRSAVTAPTGNLALVETRWTGEPADLEAVRASAGPTSQVTPIQRADIETGGTQHGLRVWDAASPAIRSFDHIDSYDFDEEWVLTGRFVPVAEDRTVPFEHIRDNGGTRDLVVPGDIIVTVDGREHTIAAFDDGGTLLLVFGDETNGSETYGAGRFLHVHREAGVGEPGEVVLDFNRAFVPPCGFSAQYNCPLPPASNRFPLPIRAGEKSVVFRDGFDIYAA
ncbi:DUF1684 domain-containing protein [Microbacterium sp. SS28]|uniref:DUF1684 domain-containing protein n=1 Tax=Microbacterium sp. SS28 TaxID=2919948 RepID=UPI001FAA8AF5|nr:DUF1684 domain-containing protein [Microbacterium sp. SS28]